MRKTDFLMDEKEKTVELEYDWALINEGMGSLCAVNYTRELLEKLIPAKREGKISALNVTIIQRSTFLISAIKSIDKDIFDIIQALHI